MTQTYTDTQNGVSGGFVVLGGLDNDPTGEGAVKTSDVTATINLNSGSATLGSIFGEVDEDGNRTTNTTVNLVGSGFLGRSEEHTSELQSLMRISYAVFCLKKKKTAYYLQSDNTRYTRMR